jgi:DNA-nicking Smr family endonuclease
MNKYARIPDEIIDLHGKTTREAEVVLNEILRDSHVKHVRVITGKATFRETGPVMKPFVKTFFESRGIRTSPAKQADGGDGALEVFL